MICLCLAAASADDGTMHGTFTVRNDWGHRFEAELVFKTTELVEGFVCTLTFNIPIKAMDVGHCLVSVFCFLSTAQAYSFMIQLVMVFLYSMNFILHSLSVER